MPRRGHIFDFNEDEIFEVTQYHEEYSISGTTLKGLAKFDDCADHGISEESHKRLIRKEIQQIIKVAADDGPFLFNSNGNLPLIDEVGFKDVSNLMDQIHCNFAIIKNENARIGLEHCPSRMEQMITEFKKSRRTLVARFKQDQDRVKGCQPKILNPPERNQDLYFKLVDYLIGSIARLVVRVATSKYWVKYLIATLAQWATKLKVISYDPVKCAESALSTGEDAVDQLTGSFNTKRALLLKVRLTPDAQEKEFDTLNAETDITTLYYDENILFRLNLQHLLKFVANGMYGGQQSSKREELGPDCFEACTLVYKTGLDGVPTALSNDRYGDISASSNSQQVNCLYSGLDLMLRNVEALKAKAEMKASRTEASSQSSLSHPIDEFGAVVKWEWTESVLRKRSSSGNMSLSRMDDIISAAVSLSLASTYTSIGLDALIHLASTGTSEEDPIMQFEPPQKGFQAIFNIVTAEFLRKQRKVVRDRYYDPEIRSVSNSPLKRGIRGKLPASSNISLRSYFAGQTANSTRIAGTDLMLHEQDNSSAETETKSQEILTECAYHKREMDKWVISEGSITIRCRGYVAFVITLALIIVCGCMAVPFAVQQKILGVDPFQITTFGWLLAGFMIVLAKSRYVSEWPWHHFLRGQVICRSIKDVHEVTRIDPQMILMNLLHGERDNILRTRGPFNGMFGRKADGPDGFSIDEPVKLSTMLASGFIVLKVINEKGEHLICEDVRKGSAGTSISRDEFEKFLACMDVGRDAIGDSSDDEEEKEGERKNEKGAVVKVRRKEESEKVLKLKVEEFRWSKVLGLYIRDSKFG